MTCILVASDLSERSDRAVRRALRLGRALDRQVHVLTVIDDAAPDGVVESHKAATEAHLARFIAAECEDGTAATEVRAGDPATAILEAADALGAGLIVLGLHRPRAMLDSLRETTMERTVRGAARPVLLVRDHVDHDYRDILVPVSFSPACAAAIRAARDIAPDGKLNLFHVVYVPFRGLSRGGSGDTMARAVMAEEKTLCREWLARYPLPPGVPDPDLVEGALGQVLDTRLSRDQPQLLAIGAHTRPNLSLYKLGDVAAGLVRNPPCDLLLARPAPG